MFWPTFSCQILITFSFLESLWHKETYCTSLQRNLCKLFANNPSKEICTFLVFLNYTSGYLKFCKTFCLIEMAWSRAFQTCIIYHFLDNFFLQTFLLFNWILQKKIQFLQIRNFFLQILKVEHKSFLMMYHLSYLDIKHWI